MLAFFKEGFHRNKIMSTVVFLIEMNSVLNLTFERQYIPTKFEIGKDPYMRIELCVTLFHRFESLAKYTSATELLTGMKLLLTPRCAE